MDMLAFFLPLTTTSDLVELSESGTKSFFGAYFFVAAEK